MKKTNKNKINNKNKMNSKNKEYIDIYLLRKSNLTFDSIKQYQSVLYGFCKYLFKINEFLEIKDLQKYDITQYQVYLRKERKLKNEVIKYKTKIILNLIDVLYEEKEDFKNVYECFVGDNRNSLYDISNWNNEEYFHKNLTKAEYKKIINKLEENKEKNLLSLIYLQIQFNNNLTLKEIIEIKKDVVYLSPTYKNFYETYINSTNKLVKIPLEAMDNIKLLYEKRKDSNPYIFAIEYNDIVSQIHFTLFNYWCICFSKIINRRIRHKYLCKKGVL